MKRALKSLANAVFLAVVFPSAVLSAFGRWKLGYIFWAQFYALAPGIPGDYLRIAYYRLTLAKCCMASRVSFGTFFAHPEARLGDGVYIGSYCVLGKAEIGDRTQIASSVQILSGRHQHSRQESGRISGSDEGVFTPVVVGADCWIGAAAIIMADIGSGTTIGAGSVVTKAIPAGTVAFGNPARPRPDRDAQSAGPDSYRTNSDADRGSVVS